MLKELFLSENEACNKRASNGIEATINGMIAELKESIYKSSPMYFNRLVISTHIEKNFSSLSINLENKSFKKVIYRELHCNEKNSAGARSLLIESLHAEGYETQKSSPFSPDIYLAF